MKQRALGKLLYLQRKREERGKKHTYNNPANLKCSSESKDHMHHAYNEYTIARSIVDVAQEVREGLNRKSSNVLLQIGEMQRVNKHTRKYTCSNMLYLHTGIDTFGACVR